MTGYDIMRTKLGLNEVLDKKEIMQFLKDNSVGGDILIDPSTTAWCAAIMNATERAAGKKGTGKLTARSFLEYGEFVSLQDARIGDILIFKRGNSSWQGHVTYFNGLTKDNDGNLIIKTLGGNQKDSVCYSYGAPELLLGVRRS